MNPIDRRKFLKAGALAAGTAVLLGGQSARAQGPARLQGQQSVFGLAAPKMDRVRVGFIGVGERGYWHVKLMSNIDGVEVKAIADPHQAVVDRALKELHDKNIALPDTYTDGDYGYRKMLERDDIDLVLIATPWRWHTPMAVEAMHSGKHVFVEVPAATSVEEAWLLVDTAEQTQKNCMMGENVCYGRNELMALNLVRQGLMGDLLHGEAAYIHELRWQMKEVDHKTGSWRTAWHAKRNGNLYPTHGLGPIAQYMNINRGDRFDYMTSISSPSLGRAAYAAREFPADHQRNQLHYINGDMNTSIIKTKLGRSIMVQHDTTTPRPYSRHNLIQGTNGVFAGYPDRIALENNPLPAGEKASFHKWDYEMDKWYEKFDHPLYKRMGVEAERNGGHGGMDFLMLWRMVYCLRNGLPLDQDVYDAASWSVVAPLSTQSVNDQGNSQQFPDFTRGDWQSNTPLGIVT